MILDEVYYPVILFGRFILYVWCSPPVFNLSLDEYFGSTSTFVSGRL